MAEVRDFDAEYDFASKEGVTFKLGGREFRTKPVASPGPLLNPGSGLDAAMKIFQAVLVPEDLDAFNELVNDPNPNVLISASQIDNIAAWLVEVTSGRPTESPASSGNGGGSDSSGSKVSSLSPVKTGGK